jgi:tryptophanyl-tRNA synthetase
MAGALKRYLEPIREKRRQLEARPDDVKQVISEGNRKARAVAIETMAEVREAVKL